MTSVEFVRWHHFFRKWDEEELNNPSKLDHYLSEILAQLERIRVPKKARSVRASKWIIKFKTRSAGKRTMTREERALQSKLAWMGSAGVELPPDVIESLKKRKDLDGR